MATLILHLVKLILIYSILYCVKYYFKIYIFWFCINIIIIKIFSTSTFINTTCNCHITTWCQEWGKSNNHSIFMCNKNKNKIFVNFLCVPVLVPILAPVPCSFCACSVPVFCLFSSCSVPVLA
jgi:hypothetical protein